MNISYISSLWFACALSCLLHSIYEPFYARNSYVHAGFDGTLPLSTQSILNWRGEHVQTHSFIPVFSSSFTPSQHWGQTRGTSTSPGRTIKRKTKTKGKVNIFRYCLIITIQKSYDKKNISKNNCAIAVKLFKKFDNFDWVAFVCFCALLFKIANINSFVSKICYAKYLTTGKLAFNPYNCKCEK